MLIWPTLGLRLGRLRLAPVTARPLLSRTILPTEAVKPARLIEIGPLERLPKTW